MLNILFLCFFFIKNLITMSSVGLKDLAKLSPFHIEPKAHAEDEEMPEDE